MVCDKSTQWQTEATEREAISRHLLTYYGSLYTANLKHYRKHLYERMGKTQYIAYIYKLIPAGGMGKACIRTGWKQVSIFFLSNTNIKLGEYR